MILDNISIKKAIEPRRFCFFSDEVFMRNAAVNGIADFKIRIQMLVVFQSFSVQQIIDIMKYTNVSKKPCIFLNDFFHLSI